MTLKELSEEYKRSAEKIREQLAKLRLEEKENIDPVALEDIRYRIKVLTPVLTELNKLGERCGNYYGAENGGVEQCDGECMERNRVGKSRAGTGGGHKNRVYEKPFDNNGQRTFRNTERNSLPSVIGRDDLPTGGKFTKRLQKYGL